MLSFTEPDRLPVMGVSWEDAKAFCRWLSKRHNLTYDLPSEGSGNSRAARGARGSGRAVRTRFISQSMPCSDWPEAAPVPVGSRQPNEFELFDMHGNADEWCLDWHNREFYAHCPVDDPVCLESPSDPGLGRVMRWCLEQSGVVDADRESFIRFPRLAGSLARFPDCDCGGPESNAHCRKAGAVVTIR